MASKKDMRRADLGKTVFLFLFFAIARTELTCRLVAVIPYVDPPKEKSETDMGGTCYSDRKLLGAGN